MRRVGASQSGGESAEQIGEPLALVVAETVEGGLDGAAPVRGRGVDGGATLVGDPEPRPTRVVRIGLANDEPLADGGLDEPARPRLVHSDRLGELGDRHQPALGERGEQPGAGDRARPQLPGAARTPATEGSAATMAWIGPVRTIVLVGPSVVEGTAVPWPASSTCASMRSAPLGSSAAPKRCKCLLDPLRGILWSGLCALVGHLPRLHVI